MLLRDFIRDARQALGAQYPAAEAASLVEILCAEVLGVSRVRHIIEPDFEVSPSKEGTLLQYLDRLVSDEPVQYILGHADFYGRRFTVTPSVLIPRQETELLVHEVLSLLPDRSAEPAILDLCTGSGCIAWTLAAELPGSRVRAVDISEDALSVARNQHVDTPNRPQFIRADVLDHEPELALFVPDSDPLLFYRALARIAGELRPRFGIVEINEAFAPEVEALFRAAGFSETRTIVDFFGKNRHVFFAE